MTFATYTVILYLDWIANDLCHLLQKQRKHITIATTDQSERRVSPVYVYKGTHNTTYMCTRVPTK